MNLSVWSRVLAHIEFGDANAESITVIAKLVIEQAIRVLTSKPKVKDVLELESMALRALVLLGRVRGTVLPLERLSTLQNLT